MPILFCLFLLLFILSIFTRGAYANSIPIVWDILRSEFMLNHEATRPEVQAQLRWLLAHPQFGPLIVNWERHGAVSRKAKWLATLTMMLAAALMLWYVPLPWVKWLSVASMACVCTWLWLRPLPPQG